MPPAVFAQRDAVAERFAHQPIRCRKHRRIERQLDRRLPSGHGFSSQRWFSIRHDTVGRQRDRRTVAVRGTVSPGRIAGDRSFRWERGQFTAQNAGVRRRDNSNPNLAIANAKQRDRDPAVNHHGLANFAGENEHVTVLCGRGRGFRVAGFSSRLQTPDSRLQTQADRLVGLTERE